MEGRYINIVVPGMQLLTLCEVKVSGQPAENLAPKGIATQSGQLGNGSPDKAIDGNHDSNWNHGSCSCTLNLLSPWWRLDLLKPHEIKTVTVTIREDIHYKNIHGAEIRIGNSLNNNGNSNPRCAVMSNPAPGSTNTYVCKGMEGRYINILIPGKKKFLTLCEVKVTGHSSHLSETNIAKGAIATQSSNFGTASPDKAIDGNHDSDWNHGSCSSTKNDMSPWWRLDLLKTYKISTLKVTIRKDIYHKRINGAEIRIGNSLEHNGNINPRCAIILNPAPGSTNTYDCKGMQGRYINILIPGKREYLTLCEIEVTETNIAKGGIATQSSQSGHASPDKAIDGNHDSNWNHGSCISTLNLLNPWWRLDLLKPHKIKTVTVTIREDAFYKRIDGAEIRIGNSLNDNGNANPSQQDFDL
ncbi:uncharacterized protein LOC142879599 [Nelusetta ayraudi]|uniref:uncharacterized protein LOC142879599 n=1 Tax=Nelusetta ayraudi TaxID=303726 RepID=UPI003F6E52EF